MDMFDKKIKQIRNKRIILAILVLIIASIILVLAIIQLLPKEIEYVEFKKDNISQKAAISDIRAFHKSEGEDDMEISVESAMRHYLGIDCFSSV